jgi:hypothetical protein
MKIRQIVPKLRRIKFRRRGITQKITCVSLHPFLIYRAASSCNLTGNYQYLGVHGGAVGRGTAQQTESRGFISRWGLQDFSLTSSIKPHYGTMID